LGRKSAKLAESQQKSKQTKTELFNSFEPAEGNMVEPALTLRKMPHIKTAIFPDGAEIYHTTFVCTYL
jgi:hypothetical protein